MSDRPEEYEGKTDVPEPLPDDDSWIDGPVRGFQPKDDLDEGPPDIDDSGTAAAQESR